VGVEFCVAHESGTIVDKELTPMGGFGGLPRWSYSGFSFFRTLLADEVGISLSSMQGFGGDGSWLEVDDDLVPLLNHSDCDGSLSPEDCARVAPRLRELVSRWEGGYDRDMGLRLAEIMELCVVWDRRLLFI